MTNEENVVLAARYLIEDNEHEYLYYDENARSDLTIVRSILKKMIGSLPAWDKHKIQEFQQEIVDVRKVYLFPYL